MSVLILVSSSALLARSVSSGVAKGMGRSDFSRLTSLIAALLPKLHLRRQYRHLRRLFIYLFVYGFATFAKHDVISNKKCNIVQVTQNTRFVIFFVFRFVTWNGFSKGTNRKRFPVTFSLKYVL